MKIVEAELPKRKPKKSYERCRLNSIISEFLTSGWTCARFVLAEEEYVSPFAFYTSVRNWLFRNREVDNVTVMLDGYNVYLVRKDLYDDI